MELLNTKPRIVNVGVESFNESIVKYEGKSVQFDWKPMAGGNKKMIGILSQLKRMEAIDEMNQKVVERLKSAQPFLIDIVPAKSVIEPLNGKVPVSYTHLAARHTGLRGGILRPEQYPPDPDFQGREV